jgi:2-polyprenyl-3-methyl-5-hydroxy-6-metoxy-1,4-benzoquinol methylase
LLRKINTASGSTPRLKEHFKFIYASRVSNVKMTGTQYDKIADDYNNAGPLHNTILTGVAVQTYVGNVRGLDVLDLGCGTGSYSRKFIESGANKVVGIDNSEAMVESARRQAVVSGLSEFHVADASEPLHLGEFDLVLAVLDTQLCV